MKVKNPTSKPLCRKCMCKSRPGKTYYRPYMGIYVLNLRTLEDLVLKGSLQMVARNKMLLTFSYFCIVIPMKGFLGSFS